MRVVDIIAKKRDGEKLTAAEITEFVQGYVGGAIPDYQASAWLMAVFLRGMDFDETAALTQAIVCSGSILDLSGIAPFVVDKHSTGGVGDKTTLVVAPLVAACGVPVAKMSGRALGFTGGTLDKLESIPGFRSDLTTQQFLAQVREHGIVVAGQSADLTPADGKLYALRDVTATVDSFPLIASSIMSKKIASGANGIVLDVKVGRGAFMRTDADAEMLAQTMLQIGRSLGRRVTAVLSDMSQPLGLAVGNALELREALDTLRGEGPTDFVAHCQTIATEMLLLAGRAACASEAARLLAQALASRKALRKFQELVSAQGGDVTVVQKPELLPSARLIEPLLAARTGYVSAIDAMEVGLTAALLGAGRSRKGETVDHAVGVVMHRKVGDAVTSGEAVLTIHANHEDHLTEARARLLAAVTIADERAEPPPLVHRVIRDTDLPPKLAGG